MVWKAKYNKNKCLEARKQRGLNKRQRIPKGQSKMNNPEKLATQDSQDMGCK